MNDLLNRILLGVAIENPDNRPLYSYKISNENYNELKKLLTRENENTRLFSAAFVLYAAEFLRAESIESHLSWDYIFNSIGKNQLNTHNVRSPIIKKGLHYWGRSIYMENPRKLTP